MNGDVMRPDFNLLLRVEGPHKVLFIHGELWFHQNGVRVEHVFYVRADTGKPQAANSLQSFAVLLRDFDAASVKRIQLPQLNQANRSLYVRQAIVEANIIEI